MMFHAIREYCNKSTVMDYGLENGRTYDSHDPKKREFIYKRIIDISNTKGQTVFPVYYSPDKAYKRNYLIDNDLTYPVGLAKSEDKVFVCKCFMKMRKLCCIEDAFYHYRMNDESICHRFSANMDEQRIQLADVLEPIVNSMDRELGELLGDSNYHRIYDGYMRFIFGMITDVLFLKFYHKDNPLPASVRRREVKEFLRKEHFSSSITKCKFNNLSKQGLLKKVLLRSGLVDLLVLIKRLSERKVVLWEGKHEKENTCAANIRGSKDTKRYI